MFRAFRLRAILFPLGVAIASITAVAWYGLIKIPAQQRYITDRNLRLLKTKAAQIKSKVDNYDTSIDNALDFYPQGERDAATYAHDLERYLRRFASALEILPEYGGGAAELMQKNASDPPRVTVQRDEGRNFLYLGYKHNGKTIVARTDIEKAVAPFLSAGSEFDAVLLVTRDGSVIAQQSASGLELAHVDGLRRSTAAAAGSTDPKGAAAPTLFEQMRKSTNVENVILGNAEYQLYVQPLQLSLATAEGDMKGQEEWALCGLVRGDHFRAAGSAISYTYLLWFGAALATVCLAIPLLKLHILSPNERFRGADGVFVAMTTFAAAGLITFCAIDAYYFHVEVTGRARAALAEVADDIGTRFRGETTAIAAQMNALRQLDFWKDNLNYTAAEVPPQLQLGEVEAGALPTTIRFDGHYLCVPEWACRDNILVNNRTDFEEYPYFDNVMWLDNNGWQRIKWSASRVTPLLDASQNPYFQQLKASRIVSQNADGSGIGVIQSRNTGEVLTIFWHALDDTYDAPGAKVRLIGQAMVATPMSLVNPVVPSHMQFVVIDSTGRVMFHSDPTRSLRENFFVECEDNPELRSAVSGRHSQYVNASYFARSYALYVTPLDVTAFGDPGWTLVVLGDRSVMETVNLETLAASALMFVIYGMVVAAVWALLCTVHPRLMRKWFWPERSARTAYRDVMIVNGVLGALFLGGITRLSSAPLLAATGLLVAVAFISTFVIVTRRRAAGETTAGWETMFHGARASLLFVVAAVPAIACFLVAYNFEMTLFARSRLMASAAQLDAREGRIKARAAKYPLCKSAQAADTCPDIGQFIAGRRQLNDAQRPWDVVVRMPAEGDRASVNPPAVTYLFLRFSRDSPSINDVAVELSSVLPRRTTCTAPRTGHRWREWVATGDVAIVLAEAPGSIKTLSAGVLQAQSVWTMWLVASGLIVTLYVLVSIVVRPLYLLDLHGVRAVGAADVRFDRSGHTLLVGPPGSGKTARLAREEHIRIFDARTRAFYERRGAARSAPSESRRLVHAGAGHGLPWPEMDVDAPPPAGKNPDTANGDWLDVSLLPSDPAAPIGIDHLEYSLDDPADRPKMLRFLEALIYHHKRTVRVAAAREPFRQLRELTGDAPDAAEMARWIRVFQSFREEPIGLTRSHLGEPYFRSVWSSCSTGEQLVLRQLADEGIVNPRNDRVVEQLMRRGLIERDRTFHMDGAFRRFVQQTMTADEVGRRESEGVSLPWASITTAALTVALGLGALLVLTSQQMVDAWIGYMPALAPAVPTVLKLLGSARGDSKASIPVNV
jgi:hypothetical protein